MKKLRQLNAQSWDLVLKIYFIVEMQKIENTSRNVEDLKNAKDKLLDLEGQRTKIIKNITS